MNVLSLFSGIGGFDLGFERAGMTVVGVCEIDKHAQKILQRHFPAAVLHTDVRKVSYERGTIDVVCGGFPCQDISVAGKRAGLAGERSGLWFEFARIIDETQPAWVVIENVPGLFSSARGADFAEIIQWLDERGYGVAWRVLDAQGFGLAQRRKRVFIVASFGSPRCAKVLFESESGERHHQPSRTKGKADSRATADSTKKSWAWKVRAGGNPSGVRGGHQVRAGGLGYLDKDECAFTVSAMQDQWVAYQDIAPTLRSEAKQSLMSGDGNINAPLAITYAIQGNIIDREVGGAEGIGIAENAPMYTLTSTDRRGVGVVGLNGNHLCWTPLDEQSHTLSTTRVEQVYIPPSTDENAQDIIWESTHTDSPARICTEQHIAPTLQARMGTGGNSTPFVGVRRLTPTECERLQGFPDGWTDGQADSHRYKQLGNAVAVPVAEWIGRRMKEVHNDGAI
jgi:DNA (cytosine-5)-methyltransferase 1